MKSSNKKLKIMDRSYDCCSEEILCSSLGSYVLDIDLSWERINCAKQGKLDYED